MDDVLFIEGLPSKMGNGSVLKLLIEVGGLAKEQVGKIVVRQGMATVGIEDGQVARAVRKVDGTTIEGRRLRAWQRPDEKTADPHFAQLLRWLRQEAAAERQQLDSQQAENHLERLVIKEMGVGLGGLTLVKFRPRNEQATLPWTPLGAGSPVTVSEMASKGQQRWSGIVTQRQRSAIEVSFQQSLEPEEERPLFAIDLAHDAIARQRMEQAVGQVMAAKANRLAELRDILLGRERAHFAQPIPLASHLAHGLNDKQQTAVSHALAAKDVAIIHGPPGTGKTTTLIAFIRAAVARGERVLACASSNMAVDNLCMGLLAAGEKIVRLGHPARIQPELLAHTLDAQVEQLSDYRLAQKMRREAFGLQGQAHKWRRAKPERGAKQALRQEANELFATARQLEAQAVEHLLDTTPILLATLTGLNSSQIGQQQFDVCVIDEAGQSVEPATWIPLTRAKRVVLAGDHQQLPPTVLSQTAAQAGFSRSMMERLIVEQSDNAADTPISHQLTVQYRMHQEIMGFSSNEFYEDSLVADASVAQHLLVDLGVNGDVDLAKTAVTFIDTAGAGYEDEQEPDGNSRQNPQEATLVAAQALQLRDAGVGDIGIITPYAAQVRLLQAQLPDDIEISSVDGFQGREKEAIIISLVRSNYDGNIGFLAETRRMNVALTRARRKLIVVGDSATITADPFYGRLVDYFEKIGAYRSVWEL